MRNFCSEETAGSRRVTLAFSRLEAWRGEVVMLDYGMILICREGEAEIFVNFSHWRLQKGAVLTVFPNDTVRLHRVSPDFRVEALRYDAALLREASLQLEQTVYSHLRRDRCRSESPLVTEIIDGMFRLLRIYFQQDDCTCTEQLALLQLKAFFLGFHDYLLRFPERRGEDVGTCRTQALFNRFMELLESRHRESRDVAFFATLLNISPKYLNTIVRQHTGETAKVVIDHYVVLQLKLSLRNTTMSVKELAFAYGFSTQSFFCSYFRQRTGTTPQLFRRRSGPAQASREEAAGDSGNTH